MDETKPESLQPLIDRIEAHFGAESSKEIVRRSQRLLESPDGRDPRSEAITAQPAIVTESALIHPVSLHVPLSAYLASALTGLSNEDLLIIDELSELADLACRAVDVDLYQPAKHTDPRKHAGISSTDVFKRDRERVITSDLLIHLCHLPSTGSGEELGFAYEALIPIILVAPGRQSVSRMVTGIPSLKIEIRYRERREVCELLQENLWELRPYLEQRRLNMAEFSQNIVGAKVKELRQEERLTREELASRVGLTVDGLTDIEENIDTISNPSLTVLRSLATVLKTTVAELVNPDYGDSVVSAIQALVHEGAESAAARFQAISKRDRWALMRRYLIHVLDAVENRNP
jgi:transcriptional regulator with XRE-family HTH domain